MWNIAQLTCVHARNRHVCMPGIEVTLNSFSRAVPHQLSYTYQLINLCSKVVLA